MSRLSPEQLEQVQRKAISFQQNLVEKAQRQVAGERPERGVFFTMLFRLAGELIEDDVESFCDRAEATFEEIEAYGQEPTIDDDWLGEIVGDRDTFNFWAGSFRGDTLVRSARLKLGRHFSLRSPI